MRGQTVRRLAGWAIHLRSTTKLLLRAVHTPSHIAHVCSPLHKDGAGTLLAVLANNLCYFHRVSGVMVRES